MCIGYRFDRSFDIVDGYVALVLRVAAVGQVELVVPKGRLSRSPYFIMEVSWAGLASGGLSDGRCRNLQHRKTSTPTRT